MKNKPADIPYDGLDPNKIKNAKPKPNQENINLLSYYIVERYGIHLKKDIIGLPPPWTKDFILRQYSFTNVRREHDKTTKYLLNKVEEHEKDSYSNKLMNIILFRLFNKIETSELLGWVDFRNYDSYDYRKKLMGVPEGYVYFSNAFLMSGTKKYFKLQVPCEEFLPMTILTICDRYRDRIVEGIGNAKTPQDVISTLKSVEGIGNFLAYQMFVDFTYLPEFPFSENEFVVAGPGCIRGLKYMFKDWDGLTAEELLFYFRDNFSDILGEKDFGKPNKAPFMVDLAKHDRVMNIMSLENCMCEISKYIRASRGLGRPRSLYKYNK